MAYLPGATICTVSQVGVEPPRCSSLTGAGAAGGVSLATPHRSRAVAAAGNASHDLAQNPNIPHSI